MKKILLILHVAVVCLATLTMVACGQVPGASQSEEALQAGYGPDGDDCKADTNPNGCIDCNVDGNKSFCVECGYAQGIYCCRLDGCTVLNPPVVHSIALPTVYAAPKLSAP